MNIHIEDHGSTVEVSGFDNKTVSTAMTVVRALADGVATEPIFIKSPDGTRREVAENSTEILAEDDVLIATLA